MADIARVQTSKYNVQYCPVTTSHMCGILHMIPQALPSGDYLPFRPQKHSVVRQFPVNITYSNQFHFWDIANFIIRVSQDTMLVLMRSLTTVAFN